MKSKGREKLTENMGKFENQQNNVKIHKSLNQFSNNNFYRIYLFCLFDVFKLDKLFNT